MAINTTHKYFIQTNFQEGVMDRVLVINSEYNCEMHLIHENDTYHIEVYFNEFNDILRFIAYACDEDFTIYATLTENPDYDPDLLKKKALDEAISVTLNPQF